MNNRTNKAVEEFYSSLTIARLLNIKAEDVQNFCYQHKIKTKVHDNGNESKLFVSSKSLLDHLARSKVSDQTDIALKWQALKQSIDSKNNKRIDRKPKKKQELPTCSEMPEGFVIAKEAARMLGLHENYISLLCRKGELEAKKIGFKWVVSIRSCEDLKSKYNLSTEIPEGFVDAKEAARMLDLNLRYVRSLCSKGKLGTKKIKHRHGFKYVVSIRSCEDLMEARKNIFKKCEELIEKCGKGDISVDAAYQKIKTNKEDKMNQDNNFKLPSIDNYMLSHVIDLNTLALVYPNLRDWLAENENATIRKFIVDTIKQMDHLSKNCKHGE
jgi:hypothetical protein